MRELTCESIDAQGWPSKFGASGHSKFVGKVFRALDRLGCFHMQLGRQKVWDPKKRWGLVDFQMLFDGRIVYVECEHSPFRQRCGDSYVVRKRLTPYNRDKLKRFIERSRRADAILLLVVPNYSDLGKLPKWVRELRHVVVRSYREFFHPLFKRHLLTELRVTSFDYSN